MTIKDLLTTHSHFNSEFNMVKPLESAMDKLGIEYSKWIDEEGNNDGK